ncbi:unnamed protein product [Fraxinus pennsylvanica]|uniref:Uncharacterized protein n=1 Tax=Fraxinus pennsylvanica TaxID=56036 RepID=A0AAD1YYA8_9LAMI|nr:unnamed protein product [Fraxinus pennsylvanica]
MLSLISTIFISISTIFISHNFGLFMVTNPAATNRPLQWRRPPTRTKKFPTILEVAAPPVYTPQDQEKSPAAASEISEDGFETELLGLTGGFPGSQHGLKMFIEQNPPPEKGGSAIVESTPSSSKLKAPELPGMIAIVKNPSYPFYMYFGIVQRITDGKAGVLSEGGNWDRLEQNRWFLGHD